MTTEDQAFAAEVAHWLAENFPPSLAHKNPYPYINDAEVAAVVDQALADASRRWSGGAPVRFVADTSVIERWSDAKG